MDLVLLKNDALNKPCFQVRMTDHEYGIVMFIMIEPTSLLQQIPSVVFLGMAEGFSVAKAQVKGSAVAATYNWVVKNHGETGWNKILSLLGRKERKPVTGRILVGRWYPFETFVALLRAIDDTYGKGDNKLLVTLGKFSCEDGLSTVYRFFYKIGSPNFIISRAAKVWSSYYDPGDMKVKKNEKGHAIVELRNWPIPRKEHCVRVKGWIIRAIEMSGGKEVQVKEVKCQCEGDRICRYDMKWD